MDKWAERPRDFGEILDLTFLVLRKQFAKLLLIMMILTGPILLVQAIAMYSGGIPFLPGQIEGRFSSIDNFLATFGSSGIEQVFLNVGGIELVILIGTIILLAIILLPVALASISILTHKEKSREPIEIGQIIKQAFSRFWPLLGGTTVYMLIAVAFIAIPSFALPFIFIYGGIWDISAWFIAFGVVVGLALLFGITYLLTRWGFYFVAIIFEKVSPGLSKSWQLTNGQFWRLLGLYIVLNIIVSIITSSVQLVSDLFLANSIIGFLIYTVVSGLSYMIMNIAYTILYFDLRVRNQGADLIEMVDSFQPTMNEPITTEPVDKMPELESNETEK